MAEKPASIESRDGRFYFSSPLKEGDTISCDSKVLCMPPSDWIDEKLFQGDALANGMLVVPKTVKNPHLFSNLVRISLVWIEDKKKHALKSDAFPTTKQVVSFLREYCTKSFDDSELEAFLNTWQTNCVQGLFLSDLELPHSYTPNLLVRLDGDKLVLQAWKDISTDEPLSISRIPLMFLYSDAATRQLFRNDSNNDASETDIASQIPCKTCHPEYDEAIQYDDDEDVKVHYMALTKDGNYVCFHCQGVHALLPKVTSVMSKLQAYLLQESYNDLPEHLSLATCVLGSRHWTTNLLHNLHLEQQLEALNDLESETNDERLADIAQAADSMERLLKFHESKPWAAGHWLGDHCVQLARCLVSLEDVKSCKYARDWLDRVLPLSFVEQFVHDEGQLRVIAALRDAWKRQDCKPTAKKQRR